MFRLACIVNPFVRRPTEATRERQLKNMRNLHRAGHRCIFTVGKIARWVGDAQPEVLPSQKATTPSTAVRILIRPKPSIPHHILALCLEVPLGGTSKWPLQLFTPIYISALVPMAAIIQRTPLIL